MKRKYFSPVEITIPLFLVAMINIIQEVGEIRKCSTATTAQILKVDWKQQKRGKQHYILVKYNAKQEWTKKTAKHVGKEQYDQPEEYIREVVISNKNDCYHKKDKICIYYDPYFPQHCIDKQFHVEQLRVNMLFGGIMLIATIITFMAGDLLIF